MRMCPTRHRPRSRRLSRRTSCRISAWCAACLRSGARLRSAWRFMRDSTWRPAKRSSRTRASRRARASRSTRRTQCGTWHCTPGLTCTAMRTRTSRAARRGTHGRQLPAVQRQGRRRRPLPRRLRGGRRSVRCRGGPLMQRRRCLRRPAARRSLRQQRRQRGQLAGRLLPRPLRLAPPRMRCPGALACSPPLATSAGTAALARSWCLQPVPSQPLKLCGRWMVRPVQPVEQLVPPALHWPPTARRRFSMWAAAAPTRSH